MQDERDDEAGAVLAVRAVEEKRRRRRALLEHGAELVAASLLWREEVSRVSELRQNCAPESHARNCARRTSIHQYTSESARRSSSDASLRSRVASRRARRRPVRAGSLRSSPSRPVTASSSGERSSFRCRPSRSMGSSKMLW